MPEYPGVMFFNTSMAFQAFAGAPLKMTDLVTDLVTEDDRASLEAFESFLKDIKRRIYDQIELMKTSDPAMAQDFRNLYKQLDKWVK